MNDTRIKIARYFTYFLSVQIQPRPCIHLPMKCIFLFIHVMDKRARTGQFEFIFLAGSFKMVSYRRGLFGRKLTPG